MTNKNLMNPISNALFFNVLMKISSIGKMSFILGSHAAFFTAAAIVMPLSGAFAGIAGSCAAFGLGVMIRGLLTGSMPLYFLAYHIPGLCASLYWATSSKILRIAPALLCMILFLIHPVGFGAAWYSLFWLIPIILTFRKSSGLFATALASTFTAHAVGTLIWLYTLPMAPHDFIALVPVVLVERLLFAAGMVVGYKAIAAILVMKSAGSVNFGWLTQEK